MPFAACGDGIVALTEQCDDGNELPGDGCSELCGVEPGARCEGEPSTCARTLCGDGIAQGIEACDDGNERDGDGCSARCEREPDCAGTACQASCGDGFVVGETCDDGNRLDRDGCSASCEVELGSVCRAAATCELVAGQCTRRVPVVFRDFSNLQPDFGNNVCNARATGAVSRFLDVSRKPALAGGTAVTEACLSTPESFAAWFTDAPDRPTLGGELLLFDDGLGGYTNRFGAEGQRFQVPQTAAAFDGTPLFFPVDTLGGPTAQPAPASIPVQYGVPQVTAESTLFPGAPNHNFAFTAQLEVPFLYDAASVASLTIAADDDVWVFVNGTLALDLGGVHEPITASLLIDGSIGSVTTRVQDGATETAVLPGDNFGLLRDAVHLLSIFHAEREPPVSSLLLQMSGLGPAPSQCQSICGDAVLSFSEECDDGVNDGGYGECGPGCRLGPYCGDGIAQAELGESCDAGPILSANCRGCRVVAAN
jgi:fibro-slime domain-containing protein